MTKNAKVSFLIANYYDFLQVQFESIDTSFYYQIAIEKINFVKMFIQNYKKITDDNTFIHKLIKDGERKIQAYVKKEINNYLEEITHIHFNFEIFNCEEGKKLKIILQKLSLYELLKL